MNRHFPPTAQRGGTSPISHGLDDVVPQKAGKASRRGFLAQRQRAEVSLMVRKEAGLRARANISNGGLLSIAALVSSILLTTTVLVHVAVRDGKHWPWSGR
jgi:hypothetical protein